MCSCKSTPIQRLETRLVSRGWGAMNPSDYQLINEFIFQKLGVRPETYQETQLLFNEAKKVKH